MKTYNYSLYLMGSKEPLILTQTQGQKLAMALMQPNCPKFVLLDDNVIAVSSISSLRQVKTETRNNKFGVEETFDLGIEPEVLTAEEVEIHHKYIEMRSHLSKQFSLK